MNEDMLTSATVRFAPSVYKALNQEGVSQEIADSDVNHYHWQYQVSTDKDNWNTVTTTWTDFDGKTGWDQSGLGTINSLLVKGQQYYFKLAGYTTGTNHEKLWEGTTNESVKINSKSTLVTIAVKPVGTGSLYFDITSPAYDWESYRTTWTDDNKTREKDYPDIFIYSISSINGVEIVKEKEVKTSYSSVTNLVSYTSKNADHILTAGTYILTIQQQTYRPTKDIPVNSGSPNVVKTTYTDVDNRSQLLIFTVASGVDTTINGSLDSTTIEYFHSYEGMDKNVDFKQGDSSLVKSLDVTAKTRSGSEASVANNSIIEVFENSYVTLKFTTLTDANDQSIEVYVNKTKLNLNSSNEYGFLSDTNNKITKIKKISENEFRAYGKLNEDYMVTVRYNNETKSFTIKGKTSDTAYFIAEQAYFSVNSDYSVKFWMNNQTFDLEGHNDDRLGFATNVPFKVYFNGHGQQVDVTFAFSKTKASTSSDFTPFDSFEEMAQTDISYQYGEYSGICVSDGMVLNVTEQMVEPVLSTTIDKDWWSPKSNLQKSQITSIAFKKNYTQEANLTESWNVDVDGIGLVKAYTYNDGHLVIATTDDSTIYANKISISLFKDFTSVTNINFENFNTSYAVSMCSMFESCESLASLDLSSFDTSNVLDMAFMFIRCENLSSITFGTNWNTSNVISMPCMFNDCHKLTSLDLSSWDTSKVVDMDQMFTHCSELTSLDLSGWNTSKVVDMYQMFNDCTKLSSIAFGSNWDTSNVTDMDGMFYGCKQLTALNLSNWNTSKVTFMGNMFRDCFGLTSLDLSSWDTSKVTEKDNMFTGFGNSVGTKTITINPTYESFFNEVLTGWTHTSGSITYTNGN